MGQVVEIPYSKSNDRYSSRLQTSGSEWVTKEKLLLDKTEFLEAMIMVLNDVRIQNIQSRDFSMMEIVDEEIVIYHQRLDDTRHALNHLRKDFDGKAKKIAN